MTRKEFDQLATRLEMTERNASPFGRPHYVNDAHRAEVEIIIRGQHATLEILFEAESLSHLNSSTCQLIEEWTLETAEAELARLFRRRTHHQDEAAIFADLEAA